MIDPHTFNDLNNIGKVSTQDDQTDADKLVVTVVTHDERDGSTKQTELTQSKAELQRVYTATLADATALEAMATAMGITLEGKP